MRGLIQKSRLRLLFISGTWKIIYALGKLYPKILSSYSHIYGIFDAFYVFENFPEKTVYVVCSS
jgi:hypothetical protein